MEAVDTKTRLMLATVTAVREFGYAGATMARISERAGVTRGAIQHCFGDRRVDLIFQTCEDILNRRQFEYRDSIESLLDIAVVRKKMKLAYRDPETWFLLEVWIASNSDPALADKIDALLKTGFEGMLDSELEKLARVTGAYPGNFTVVKCYFRSLTRGLAVEYSRSRDITLFDSVVDLAVDMLETTLRARSGPGS
ncbi:transcriptional regulator, TetR family [Burkholderia sp. D7]|nr:transcriptional regulator, TetR family [Burkholderia sp. D7]